jgi:hypothetical protein
MVYDGFLSHFLPFFGQRNRHRDLSNRWPILVTRLAVMALPALALAQDLPRGDFKLTVSPDKQVSLTANEASLEAIVAELGVQLGANVSGGLSEDKRVTTHLSDVPVSEALKQIGDSYVLVTDAKDGGAQMIILLGKGRDRQDFDDPVSNLPAEPGSETSQGGFRFEFDPSTAPIRERESDESESNK